VDTHWKHRRRASPGVGTTPVALNHVAHVAVIFFVIIQVRHTKLHFCLRRTCQVGVGVGVG